MVGNRKGNEPPVATKESRLNPANAMGVAKSKSYNDIDNQYKRISRALFMRASRGEISWQEAMKRTNRAESIKNT